MKGPGDEEQPRRHDAIPEAPDGLFSRKEDVCLSGTEGPEGPDTERVRGRQKERPVRPTGGNERVLLFEGLSRGNGLLRSVVLTLDGLKKKKKLIFQ